jgi:hypothetical protein
MPDFLSIVADFMESHEQLLARLLAISVFVFFLFLALRHLKRAHSTEIYLIWYAFSLLFAIFSGFVFVATKRQIKVPSVCGEYAGSCSTLIGWFVSVHDELILAGSLLAIGIVPQVMAYFLSGLTGSASPPKFVWHIEQVAVWSLIKFLARFGGITMGIATGEFAAGKPLELDVLLGRAVSVCAAFYLAAIETWLGAGLPTLWRSHEKSLWMLAAVHRFFTRNAPKDT